MVLARVISHIKYLNSFSLGKGVTYVEPRIGMETRPHGTVEEVIPRRWDGFRDGVQSGERPTCCWGARRLTFSDSHQAPSGRVHAQGF